METTVNYHYLTPNVVEDFNKWNSYVTSRHAKWDKHAGNRSGSFLLTQMHPVPSDSNPRDSPKGNENTCSQKDLHRASLGAQWLRVCLPMQGTRVRALVREDPTCRGATKPVSHNY